MATTPTDTTFDIAFEPPVQRAQWTVADLLDQLGGIPPERVHLTPTPGTATEKDVLEMDDHGGRICELIDGTLVEKTMGVYESWLACRIIHFISSFLEQHDLGIVTGPDGFLKLFPRQVRAPDVAFIRREAPARRPGPPRSHSRAGPQLGSGSALPEQHPPRDGTQAPRLLCGWDGTRLVHRWSNAISDRLHQPRSAHGDWPGWRAQRR